MLPPLDEWDEAILTDVAGMDECRFLEKKASDKLRVGTNLEKTAARAELAKQVCAFSNAGLGYLVYGMPDTGGFDQGVPEILIGTQEAKAWVEYEIPKLVTPPVHGFQARFIHVPAVHDPGFGVLVVEVPLSDLRPHWVEDNQELAYIRTGEHSHPMTRQTFLDISSEDKGDAARFKIRAASPFSPSR